MTQISTPTLSAPSERLTHGELRALRDLFNEQGYVVIKNVVPRDKLEELTAHIRAEYKRVRSNGALFSGGGQVSGHLNCFPGEESRFVYDTLVQRGIVELVQSLWPTPLRMPNIGCNFNLPGSVIQHYHTDWPFRKEFLIVNVSAVDTDLVNGATEVIPGTHKQYIPYWRFELERLPRYGKRLVSNQGDVVIRTSNLWHRGMPNRLVGASPDARLQLGRRRQHARRPVYPRRRPHSIPSELLPTEPPGPAARAHVREGSLHLLRVPHRRFDRQEERLLSRAQDSRTGQDSGPGPFFRWWRRGSSKTPSSAG